MPTINGKGLFFSSNFAFVTWVMKFFLNTHLDKFKENMRAYSEEQDERFHQDILDFERHYQGVYNKNMKTIFGD